eukprot:CAMPEP_0177779974 /NCGR_PEP_ID=MMETSP0491_2-20121128/16934_1 /TAXON_ID=63592 /ORGANISM="Tetraselmis chuii, Strain PLY429" /LENGTH=144 /DNA_ID=CAMNT_0019299671 /DNA_START=877 /DNA_END=1309 /DNA_ORIENTATION=-
MNETLHDASRRRSDRIRVAAKPRSSVGSSSPLSGTEHVPVLVGVERPTRQSVPYVNLVGQDAEQGDAAIARMVVPELQMLIRHSDPEAPLETVPSSATSEPALSADVAAPAPLMPPHAQVNTCVAGSGNFFTRGCLTLVFSTNA